MVHIYYSLIENKWINYTLIWPNPENACFRYTEQVAHDLRNLTVTKSKINEEKGRLIKEFLDK